MIEYIAMCGSGVLVLVGLFLLQRYVEKKALQTRLQRLARTPCPDCGIPYGMEAAIRAARERREAWKETLERGMYPRLMPFWHVRCDHCGAENFYDPHKPVQETAPPADSEANAFLRELQARLEEWRNAPVDGGSRQSSDTEEVR